MRVEHSPSTIFERLGFISLSAIFALSFYYKPISYYQIDERSLPLPALNVFHKFGLSGPTCGLTRSFVNLAHGRLVDGFLANFMWPFTFAAFLTKREKCYK